MQDPDTNYTDDHAISDRLFNHNIKRHVDSNVHAV